MKLEETQENGILQLGPQPIQGLSESTIFGNEKFIGYPGKTCVWERVGVETSLYWRKEMGKQGQGE